MLILLEAEKLCVILDVIRFFVLFCYAPTQTITTTATITTMVISFTTLLFFIPLSPHDAIMMLLHNQYDRSAFTISSFLFCDDTHSHVLHTYTQHAKRTSQIQLSRRFQTIDMYNTNSINAQHIHVKSVFSSCCYSMLFTLETLWRLASSFVGLKKLTKSIVINHIGSLY